jgi:hypothetical protein
MLRKLQILIITGLLILSFTACKPDEGVSAETPVVQMINTDFSTASPQLLITKMFDLTSIGSIVPLKTTAQTQTVKDRPSPTPLPTLSLTLDLKSDTLKKQ